MSHVQQLSRGAPRAEIRQYALWRESVRKYEASLLSELFRRNGREDVVQAATPPGYSYVREDATPSLPVDANGPVMQIAAHPGDGPDFFYATYLEMAVNTAYCNDYHEVLLTDGEGGVDGWNPERTRQVRSAEACAGAKFVGSTLHFLGYPDGGLAFLAAEKRKQLVMKLAEMIREIQPGILVVHPPQNDHPDHAQSFLLALAALERNGQPGRSVPTLLVHDVEFGLQQENIWLPRAFQDFTHAYAFHSPEYLVNISATHQKAQDALYEHKTQMYEPVGGRPKVYADLIDKLARVRGLQFMPEGACRIPRGQGFSHVVIPGVTSTYNALSLRLPGESLYRRVKKRK